MRGQMGKERKRLRLGFDPAPYPRVARCPACARAESGGIQTDMERTWQRDLGGIKVRVVKADFQGRDADALVIPTCNLLKMDEGIPAAVRQAGGEEIEREARELAPIAAGAAVVTGAGRLPFRAVVHAAAIGGDGSTTEARMRLCAYNALKRCCDNGLACVVMPLPSGTFSGITDSTCCRAVIEGIRDFCLAHPCALRQVELVTEDDVLYRDLAAGLERAAREDSEA